MKNNNPSEQAIIRPRMPELDYLRGVAIIMVLFAHGFFWSVVNGQTLYKFFSTEKFFILATQGGALGVNLFFILSGFLITGILLDTKNRPDYYKRFYFRRGLRILPAYLALLLILFIFGFAQWPFLLISAFFMANIAPIFGVALQYGPLWTLAVEEQFYLFWPLAVKKASRKILIIISVSIVILTPIIRMIAFLKNPGQQIPYYTWFVADGLAMGALCYFYLRADKTTRKKTFYTGILLVALSMAMFIIGYPFGIVHNYSSHYAVAGAMFQTSPFNLLFAGILMLALVSGISNFKNFILCKWLEFFGYISYGLYLIHLFIFLKFDDAVKYLSPALNTSLHETMPGLVIRFILAGGISVLIAFFSRKYYEEFFLKIKDKNL